MKNAFGYFIAPPILFQNKPIAYKLCFVEYGGTHKWWVNNNNNNNNKDNKNNENAFKSKPLADFDGS
ncbi:Eukaryotic translation initiation factor 3 110 kDa subunit [Vibrio chagasii]|nr:Eukaryotic translation initiation factor 3 110 kDa subunit [Vibrio chagasii]CAH7371199.1 Eukaryotic translation initiation factor 3 110 kDa subunit [Vibrio chagasii]CAH7435021.1 Eukaryotic translation initiation factor 3 110 kDa subunit [Vibrio chagasii]